MLKKPALIILVFCIGAVTGWGFFYARTVESDFFSPCNSIFPLLSNEIDCASIDEKIDEIVRLDRTIEDFIDQEKKAGRAKQISVFFRDLNSRRWFGINENVNFYPASLAKLPIAMMTYKTAEVNRKIFELELPVTEEDVSLNIGQHYKMQESLVAGKSYPVRELLDRMLTLSDNAPVNPLLNASTLFHEAIFSDLGIYTLPIQNGGNGQWNITTRSYANLFRVLYNASYLRSEYSNEILDRLSKSTFRNALVAGVPDTIKIAHKFGETSEIDDKTGKTLSILNDCGIVYKANAHYILCVMTEGEQYTDLENIIKTISDTVFLSS